MTPDPRLPASFLLPCILVANFRRDLTLLGTRILRKQGLLLLDPPSPNRPHIVRVEDDSSALFQDYWDYPPGTPVLECLRSRGGLLGLPTHKQATFKELLSINDGTLFDATEALNFYLNFTDLEQLSENERGIYADAINNALSFNLTSGPTTPLMTVPSGQRTGSAHFLKRVKFSDEEPIESLGKPRPTQNTSQIATYPRTTTSSSSFLRWSLFRKDFTKAIVVEIEL